MRIAASKRGRSSVTRTRTRLTTFKFKVVLEALRAEGRGAEAEVARTYGIHPVTLCTWKRECLQRGPEVFGGKEEVQAYEKRIANLELVVGPKEVESALLIRDQARVSYAEGEARDNPWIGSRWVHFKVENGSLLSEAWTLEELERVIERQMRYYAAEELQGGLPVACGAPSRAGDPSAGVRRNRPSKRFRLRRAGPSPWSS